MNAEVALRHAAVVAAYRSRIEGICYLLAAMLTCGAAYAANVWLQRHAAWYEDFLHNDAEIWVSLIALFFVACFVGMGLARLVLIGLPKPQFSSETRD